MKMKLREIAKKIDGDFTGPDVEVSSVGIDTRTIRSGDLYVAIKGQNFDGNLFVEQAGQAGAIAAIINKGVASTLPHIAVDDTRLALGRLAHVWRNNTHARVVGITGSNGKTTVKEMTAAILGVDGEVMFTKGNLNNDIGVPLTLLRITENHKYAVIEMGANHLGEIAYTCAIADPDVSILNNAGGAHIEGFGSLEGIARGKGEIIENLKSDGVTILNKDDKYFEYWHGLAGHRRVISFGLDGTADVAAGNIRMEVAGKGFATSFDLQTGAEQIAINLNLAGRHNVKNALAAAGAAIALGLELEKIKKGLESLQPVTGRLQPLAGRLGNIVIDDTYNANADSLKAGVDVLADCPGPSWVVLGAFGELGPDSPKIHYDIGQYLTSKGVVRLLAMGSDAENSVRGFGKGASFFESQQELIDALAAEMTGEETILVKGSRVQHMENVVAALVDNFRV